MKDIIIALIIALALGAAVFYIIRAKRRGEKCIGCPYSSLCSGNCPSEQKSNEEERTNKN